MAVISTLTVAVKCASAIEINIVVSSSSSKKGKAVPLQAQRVPGS